MTTTTATTPTATSERDLRIALQKTTASCMKLIDALEAKTFECDQLHEAIDRLLTANSVEELQGVLIELAILRGAR